MTWEPMLSWETEQPQRCSVCSDVYTGRELGYIPVMCDREGCPGPTDRRIHVVVAPVTDERRKASS